MLQRSLSLVALMLIMVVLSPLAMADSQIKSMTLTPAQQCQNLTCVRQNIDILDQQIITLLGQRLSYVQRAGELKSHKTSIHDAQRENLILQKVAAQAQAAGYSPQVIQAIFEKILQQSNQYEQQFHTKG